MLPDSILTCIKCHRKFPKKDIFLTKGKLISDETCICNTCLIREGDEVIIVKSGKLSGLMITVLISILVLLSLTAFYAYMLYAERQQEKQLAAQIEQLMANRTAQLTTDLRAVSAKYKEQIQQARKQVRAKTDPDMSKQDRLLADLDQSRKTRDLVTKIIRKQTAEQTALYVEYYNDLIAEVRRINPEKAKEIEGKYNLWVQTIQSGSIDVNDSIRDAIKSIDQKMDDYSQPGDKEAQEDQENDKKAEEPMTIEINGLPQ